MFEVLNIVLFRSIINEMKLFPVKNNPILLIIAIILVVLVLLSRIL
jgi:hypothetical protein